MGRRRQDDKIPGVLQRGAACACCRVSTHCTDVFLSYSRWLKLFLVSTRCPSCFYNKLSPTARQFCAHRLNSKRCRSHQPNLQVANAPQTWDIAALSKQATCTQELSVTFCVDVPRFLALEGRITSHGHQRHHRLQAGSWRRWQILTSRSLL